MNWRSFPLPIGDTHRLENWDGETPELPVGVTYTVIPIAPGQWSVMYGFMKIAKRIAIVTSAKAGMAEAERHLAGMRGKSPSLNAPPANKFII